MFDEPVMASEYDTAYDKAIDDVLQILEKEHE